MPTTMRMLAPGYRMTSDMIRSKAPVELSDGEAILCLPTLSRGATAQNLGAAVIQSDPAVEYAATEVGFSPKPDMLRAPDVAVLPGPPKDGWLKEAPPLAIEYADRGQDQTDLRKKIGEYLEHGVKLVWVVRLDGPRRVEVYTPDGKKEMFGPGTTLVAPGILANPVPVEALYEPKAARDTVLRNVLSQTGYASIEAILEEGKAEGRIEGKAEGRIEGERTTAIAALLDVYTARFGEPPDSLTEELPRRDIPTLRGLFPLFATGSREKILAHLA